MRPLHTKPAERPHSRSGSPLRRIAIAVVIAAIAAMAAAAPAGAVPIASKFTLSRHIGWEVDKLTGANICTAASSTRGECQFGQENEGPGGFKYPTSVAVDNDQESPEYGDVYVADKINHRVQVLTANGEFVLMFGWNVNKTKVTKGGATQREMNICTAIEVKAGGECQAGEPGTGLPEQLLEPESVTVDPATGNVYVLDLAYHRVEEFTATGEFVLMIGGEVNETNDAKAGAGEAEKNLCTKQEIETLDVKCKAGIQAPQASTAHSTFNPKQFAGNLLAVGGPEDLLYVGDEHRVQEFEASGRYKTEIALTSISPEPSSDVVALTVDPAGDVYLAYGIGHLEEGAHKTEPTSVVHEFHPNGTQYAEFEVLPRDTTKSQVEVFGLNGLALDPDGRLAIIAKELVKIEGKRVSRPYAALLSTSGAVISEIAPPSGEMPTINTPSVAFAASDELYVVAEGTQEIEAYVPALFPEVGTCPAEDVTATSALLCGEINPNGLPTRGFFDYTPRAGSQTPLAFSGEGLAFEEMHSQLTGLEPNETYGYRALAEAELGGEPVKELGEEQKFHTATPPVVIVGEPSASFIKASSAVLSASLNPEHATTLYHFEYAQCNALGECTTPQATPDETSSQYAVIGAAQEITRLQPQTTYRYWLVANNEHEEAGKPQGGHATGSEGSFTTGTLPTPTATTGTASALAATGATIAGTVDADGQPATYQFELGTYTGAGTQYGVVFSGPAGEGTAAIPETLGLTGLQPGTTYAYRIKITSGYGTQTGEAMLFSTTGLPEVLVSPATLALLPIPSIVFPTAPKGSTPTIKSTPGKCAKGKHLTHGKCTKSKSKKKRAKAKAKKTSRSPHAKHRL